MPKILLTGNEATGKAAIESGCKFYAGYPITPQNELTAYMAEHLPRAGGVFIQAESEVAAINMVFGAAAAGARVMTSSSSPGVSLKQEGISYCAGCELPVVIVNVQRGGPGLGNIDPAQSDYFQATKGGGHGDYHCIVLAPSSVAETFSLTSLAFTLADFYRTPVIILSDATIGQMAEGIGCKVFEGRYELAKKTWALTGCLGRKPNSIRSLFLGEGVLEKHNLRLQKKYQQIKLRERRHCSYSAEDAELLIVAYGSMFRLAKETVLTLRSRGVRAGAFQPVTLWPFPDEELRAVTHKAKTKAVLVLEMSYGQMLEDVKLSLLGKPPVFFYGRAGGGVPLQTEVLSFLQHERLLPGGKERIRRK